MLPSGGKLLWVLRLLTCSECGNVFGGLYPAPRDVATLECPDCGIAGLIDARPIGATGTEADSKACIERGYLVTWDLYGTGTRNYSQGEPEL